jgi:hypothetical protein
MMAAVVARHGVAPETTPNFPIREKSSDFFKRVRQLKAGRWISADEATAIEKTKAYDGGDHVLWHIAKLDNLRKHSACYSSSRFQRNSILRACPTLKG